MSIRIMTKVFDLSVGNSGEKLVLLALADNANDAGACWPSLKTLARKCSMSAAGVVGILGRLEKRKLITREKGGGVKNTRYQFGNELACPDQSTTFTGGSQRRLQGESTTFTGGVNDVYSHITIIKPSSNPITAKPRKKPFKASPEARNLVSAFVQAHDGFHGSPYRVTEQDGKAAEVLIASGVTETELVRVYSAAIRNTTGWQCQRATSLQRLAKYWNEVAAEVEQFDAVNHKVPMDGRDTLKEWLGV